MKKFYVLLAALVAVLAMATPANAAKPGGGGVTPNISVGCPNNALCLYTDRAWNGSMYFFQTGYAVGSGHCTNLPSPFISTVSSVINFRNQGFTLYSSQNCTGWYTNIQPVESYLDLTAELFNDTTRSVYAH